MLMVKDAYTVDMKDAAPPRTISPDLLAMLACPACHGSLSLEGNQIRCTQCQCRYPIQDGIPILLAERAQIPSAG
jgi:hypothetical protein